MQTQYIQKLLPNEKKITRIRNSCNDTLDELVNTKNDDKKKDKNSNKKRR